MVNLDIDALDRRRSTIKTVANPQTKSDYIATLDGKMIARQEGSIEEEIISVRIRYVPDALVIEKTSLTTYFIVIGEENWSSLEDTATAILGDINNEIVPRWLCVDISAPEDKFGGRHSVNMEDRQPNWDNPALLARLDPI